MAECRLPYDFIVILEIRIEKDGRVSGGRVLKPLPHGLTESAIEAVRTWTFNPGLNRGRVVPTIQNVTVNFRLP